MFSVNVKCIQQRNLDILCYSVVSCVSPTMYINKVKSHKRVKITCGINIIDLGLFGMNFCLFIVFVLHKTDVRQPLKKQ